ncbi:MAG: type II toxin-antitoxin system RelE/ParE family toxin [Spirochaetaceae bacterium]|jgi:addiction module RelE/StbE family toxin|nr:type II toxin-antitoxin system RelE/ParE family toxin [Spirochaetaceae bacterium]
MAEEIKRYNVNITATAKKDLREIISYISRNNPQNFLEILERIEARIKTPDHFPNRGSYVPELLIKNIKEYRQITESPWRIIYRVDKDIVTVLLIIDSRRNIQDILTQRLIK